MRHSSNKLTARPLAGLIQALILIVATGHGTTAGAAGIELRGAGSTFSAPLYEKWIDAYQSIHPSVAIHYDAIGSGEGIARFDAETVDFGASDVSLSAAETAKIRRGAIQVPGTAGMIVLAYNLPGLAGPLKLPQDVYLDIFMGRVRTWDDPRIKTANPGLSLPHKNIAVVGRKESSGTTFAFTSHLAAVGKRWIEEGPGVGKIIDWPAGAMIARGNEGVASRIKISDGSIGYVEYGFARRLGLPVALLQNQAGKFVAPSQESGGAALATSAGQGLDNLAPALANPKDPEAYPIVTYSWLLLYKTYPSDHANAVKSFVEFGLDAGQPLAAELGYLALPPAVADLGKSALSQIK
ncbi:phosphate ABC transporter substrate-binding protein PstS [Methylocapsa acidiphila]|uniref:phosphate ABC transporter substrate-binding protein PstS n=1 Tax=Methylocapsa acidiphila TaxID=133552 RepID=UPI00040AD631|nr:phosphate ABC transporter substrate-binding protein PstS [Methylocapsa acidiphila]